MKRQNYQAPLPVGPALRQMHPTQEKFSVEWEESLTSDWNKAALRIIIEHVMRSYPDDVDAEDQPQVANFAISHLRYLQRQYKAKPTAEKRQYAAARRNFKRKLDVRFAAQCIALTDTRPRSYIADGMPCWPATGIPISRYISTSTEP